MKDDIFSTRNMSKMALCVAFISIAGYLAFPTPFSPVMITATTLALGITALVLPPRETMITIIIWILLGAVGAPVFSGGQGGIGKLIGPSGGFFIGFFISYVLVAFFKGKKPNIIRYVLVLLIAALPLTYIPGILYMMFVLNVDMEKAITMAMLPFVPGDIIKAFVAAFIANKLNRVL